MVQIRNEHRLQLLELLPPDWLVRIERYYLDMDAIPTGVWPDEADIYAGTNREVLTALEKHGLLTDEIRRFFGK